METVVNSVVSTVREKLFKMAKEEFAMQLRLVDDVNTLQITLENVQRLLQDFENKNKNIKQGFMETWLDQINDDSYDIEDLLEEYGAFNDNNSESCCFPVEWLVSSIKKLAFNHWIGVELQRLNKQLNHDIKDQIPIISLLANNAPSGPVESRPTSNRKTTSEIVRSDIVGNAIQDDARRLIELLTKEDDHDNPLVFAIVGMGGIGKTTLAKLVLNDQMIARSFQVKVWISVTQNFNEDAILRDTIAVAGGDVERCHTLNFLCEKFKNTVEGKKLFMVLDDVWETEKVWKDPLRTLLKNYAAKGSRVLVTTRNEEVAYRMKAVHSQRVQPLPQEDGWSLLCKSAFLASDDGWNLKDIGIELVKKCDGLPLAINTIGGMLSAGRKTRESWDLVLKSSMWEVEGLPTEIHSALYVSYRDLPTNIKRCFLYCSVFPKGRYFEIMEAKNLWIQEGLIKDERNISSQDIAERYFTILVQRNLVILDRIYIEAGYFTMHDLIYSLSQFLTQNENIAATESKDILKSRFYGNIKKLRRLSIIGGSDKTTNIQNKFLQEKTSLRTLLIFDETIDKIDNDLFNHLRHLRTLWLRGTKVTKLPESLGSLKLLRYLNLSKTPIKELPKTFQNLNALRILDVSECENLCNLPPSIMKLHHLCVLRTNGSALDHLPPGVGNFNKLQHLEFIVPPEDIARESSTVKELETLTELRLLHLYRLERVLHRSEVKSVALKDKQHLKELILSCSKSDSNEVLNEDSDRIEEVFEDLRPPVHLKDLIILNYFGCKLPSWLGSTPVNIRHLLLRDCSNCKKLDGLGLLPNLEILFIDGASSIKNIGPEFYYGNNIENGAYQNYIFFPKMKHLCFENMDSWEEWSSLEKAIPVMPNLETLIIKACPKLKSFPEEVLCHAATSLKTIIIRNAAQLLLKEVHNLPCLEEFEITNIPYLERISGLPALLKLMIEDCPGMNLVELTHTLQIIEWVDFNADSLPRWFSTYGHGHDDNIKANQLIIGCKEELVRKICFNEENGVHEWSEIQHFDDIFVIDENNCIMHTSTKTPRSFSAYHGQHKREDYSGSINEVKEPKMFNMTWRKIPSFQMYNQLNIRTISYC